MAEGGSAVKEKAGHEEERAGQRPPGRQYVAASANRGRSAYIKTYMARQDDVPKTVIGTTRIVDD